MAGRANPGFGENAILNTNQVNGLLKLLEGLPEDMRKRAINLAMNAAFRELKKDAKAFAPLGPTGNLRKAIRVKKDLESRSSGIVRARMFVTYKGARKAPHAHLVHDGTQIRRVKETRWISTSRGYGLLEKGTSLGRTRPDPFMEKAWKKNIDDIIPAFGHRVRQALDRYAKKGKV